MSNTIIQIRRSTTTNIPPALEAGELAFTSNGDSLWIGSPSGANTANVIHIGSKVSYTANSTQLGDTNSNTELVSSYAIQKYVNTQISNFSTTLSGLTDVDINTVANNNILVYDGAAGKWENHTVSGTANEVNVAFSGQNITIGLPDDVTVSANLTVNSHLIVNQTSNFNNTVTIKVGSAATPHTVTNPIIQAEANTDGWTQISIHNRNGGVNASSDFIAYPNNTQNDDNTGFIDFGITGNGYNQAAYSVTGPNDGYLFVSARAGDNLSGSLVIATDSSGTNNDIKFFAGGFTYDANTPHMVLTGNNKNFGIGNNNPEDKLSVNGTTYLGSDTKTQTVYPIANTTYNLGNLDKWWNNIYVDTVHGTNGSFTDVYGTIKTGNQPSITNVGTLDSVTVTGTSTLNGGVELGSDGSDLISINGVVDTSIVPSANITTNIGSATKWWNNIYVANGNFTDITVSGNLTVQGTLTTIDTTEMIVEDPMIRLARSQANTGTFTDAVDIGFYGTYGNTSQVVYTGLARDSSSNTFVLFDGLVNQAPDNVVNTAAITVASLTAYLSSGGLVSNATHVAITANSTVNVAIIANTLTLSTALEVGSGGTGVKTIANNYLLVGNTAGPVGAVGSSTVGHVLQITTGGVPTFSGLDGGTF